MCSDKLAKKTHLVSVIQFAKIVLTVHKSKRVERDLKEHFGSFEKDALPRSTTN